MKLNFLLNFIIFFLLVLTNKCEEITIEITSESDISSSKTIGTEGIFTLVTNTSDLNDISATSEIENQFFSSSLMENDEKTYDLNCSLFDPENMNVVVKCHLLGAIDASSSYHFRFSGGKIDLDGNTITIKADENYYFDMEIKSYNIPFIYSNKQSINLNEDDSNFYVLRFKVNSYQGEKLALVAKTEGEPHSFTDFDETKLVNDELICNISRKKIEATITYQKQLNLVYLNEESGIINFEFVGDIDIEFNKVKESIVLNITKSLNEDKESNSLIAFETNIKDISPLTTDKFNITAREGNKIPCFFKKYDKEVNLSLILLCEYPDIDSTLDTGNINLDLNDINYKYDFKIVRIRAYKRFSNNYKGKQILLNYPEILDFKKSKNYTLEFFMKGSENWKSIRFIENSPILECEDKNFLKKCVITSSHFLRNETGYYHTLSTYNNRYIEINYDARPIKVIVPYITIVIEEKNNENELIVGQKGFIYFITSYKDVDDKFNFADIQEKTKFNTIINDEENNEYEANCRFWKSENKDLNLVIICQLKEDLKNGQHIISFNETSFDYDDYIVNIFPETSIKVNIYDFNTSFIYSDEQTINIDNNTEIYEYEFKFKYESFNKSDLFYIKNAKDNSVTNFAFLDKCEIKEELKELSCILTKEKIESFLTSKNETFSLGFMNDDIGAITYDIVYSININYEIKEKENVFVQIGNLLETNTTQRGTTFAYNTNVTDISNLRTKWISFSSEDESRQLTCYFKKDNFHNLLLICMTSIEKDITLNYIPRNNYSEYHYKYNFVVPSFSNYDTVYIKQTGIRFLQVYPEVLNFTSEETITIRYLINSYAYSENKTAEITLNPDSSELECKNLTGMIKCIVPRSHFENKESGYYYTRYLNQKGDFVINYDINKFNVILPPDSSIEILLESEYNNGYMPIGQNGTLYFVTSFNDTENIFNSSNIQKETTFETYIKDMFGHQYNVTCRLWKPLNDNLRLFCDLKEPLNNVFIQINDAEFKYYNYTIKIISKLEHIYVHQYDGEIPFLYSANQTINIQEEKEIYEIKFNIEKYNNENLFLVGNGNNIIFLDKTEIQNKEIICYIKKEKLEENLQEDQEIFSITSYVESLGFAFLGAISGVRIIKREIPKDDIYVGINKLLYKTAARREYIAFETNITNISNIFTKEESLRIKDINFIISLKKTEEKPLLLLITTEDYGNYSLNIINESITLDQIHSKYNFIIAPVTNEEVFEIYEGGEEVVISYPEIFNFSENDALIIKYFLKNPETYKNIRINPDSEKDLECTNDFDKIECIIPKSHFERKPNGYYYTYHLNRFGEYSPFYLLSPIKVILPIENEVVIKIDYDLNQKIKLVGKNGAISFVTELYDELNIFNISEIEEISLFNSQLKDDLNNVYNTKCRLWKPIKGNIRVFCDFEGLINIKAKYIKLNNITFEYNNQYNITIIQVTDKIKIKSIEGNIPFLYSDKQEITLEQNEDIYNLKFRQLSYEQNPLYLYKNEMKYTSLDNCRKSNNELICDINKNKLIEILSYSGEKFSLGQKLDTEGLYIFNSVLDISFNYDITKEGISIQIGNLLTPIVAKNEFIVYETNINNTNIPALVSDYFEIEIKSSQNTNAIEKIKCIFKNNGLNNLLLLCNADKDGVYSLGQINSNNLNNINILYNFKLEKSTNNYEFDISGEGTKITSVSPLEITFKGNETHKIKYETENPEKLKGLKLNNESSFDLDCEDKIWYKECSLNKTHFSKNGSYYTYHSNHKGGKTISYEIPQIKITIEKQDENPSEEDDGGSIGLVVGLCIVGGMVLIIAIIFFVWRYLRRKSGKDISLDMDKEEIELKVPISSDAKE